MNEIFFIGLYITSAVCLWILLSAILMNFYFAKKGYIKKEKKSVVETGSMLGFFIAMVLLVFVNIGKLVVNDTLTLDIGIIGTFFIFIGMIVNIAGRIRLGENWGNQIKIYEKHTLTTTGIYHLIRHPLYSSTILMLYGFAFLFQNYLVFILVSLIFIPFMIYRARQEEEELFVEFKDAFVEYKSKTGLFLPKLKK